MGLMGRGALALCGGHWRYAALSALCGASGAMRCLWRYAALEALIYTL